MGEHMHVWTHIRNAPVFVRFFLFIYFLFVCACAQAMSGELRLEMPILSPARPIQQERHNLHDAFRTKRSTVGENIIEILVAESC